MFVSTKGRPLVSAIMPTRNRARFVRHAAAQVLSQAWGNVELVIMDDSDVFERLNLGPKVKHVQLAGKMTLGEIHNKALEIAQGTYIAHWDDDDVFGPRRLLAQMEPLLTTSATISGLPIEYVLHAPTGRFFRFNDRTVQLMHRRQNQTKLARFGFHDGTAVFSRKVLRHSVTYPNVTVGEKVLFINDLIEAGAEAVDVDNRRHFVYVRHASNTWRFVDGRLLDPVPSPRWFDPAEIDVMRRAAA